MVWDSERGNGYIGHAICLEWLNFILNKHSLPNLFSIYVANLLLYEITILIASNGQRATNIKQYSKSNARFVQSTVLMCLICSVWQDAKLVTLKPSHSLISISFSYSINKNVKSFAQTFSVFAFFFLQKELKSNEKITNSFNGCIIYEFSSSICECFVTLYLNQSSLGCPSYSNNCTLHWNNVE